jgi:integrase
MREEPLKRLENAFAYVSSQGTEHRKPLKEIFHHSVSYYTMRHTFATNFMVQTMKRRNNYNEGDYLKDISLQKELADQMGHEEFDTTFKCYIVNAIVIHASEKSESPREFFTVENLVKSMLKWKSSRKHLQEVV